MTTFLQAAEAGDQYLPRAYDGAGTFQMIISNANMSLGGERSQRFSQTSNWAEFSQVHGTAAQHPVFLTLKPVPLPIISHGIPTGGRTDRGSEKRQQHDGSKG